MDTNIILKKEKIQNYNKEIRLMTKKQLLKYFGAVSSGKPNATAIIKNQIWQSYNRIKVGEEESIEGNIRTYWYSHIKPTLARVGLLKRKHDHYQTMLDVFNELVRDHKLFKYNNFGFDDENWEHWKVGEEFPNVILFAEKNGWFRTLKKFYEEYGVTIIVLGGVPSLVTTEYLTKHLSLKTSLNKPFHLISAVDYDPAGSIIANSFVEQLKSQGIEDIELTNLISLEGYTQEEIELFKFPLPSKHQIKIKKWIKETGGIDGKPYGLEADSMSRSHFKKLVKIKLSQLLKAPSKRSEFLYSQSLPLY